MRQTVEQRTASNTLAAATPAYRQSLDPEGWPIVPGRYGCLEHDGRALAVYTGRPRLHSKLLVTPGVVRHQRGDFELRAWVAEEAVPAVARLIGARRRRTQTSARSIANLRSRAGSGAQEES